MSFMKLHITPKGALYSADCLRCGQTYYAHEWASDDPNGDRDAMQSGRAHCPECSGLIDPQTFIDHGRRHYAARYSADGYMDCTYWSYGRNRRALMREVTAMYGE